MKKHGKQMRQVEEQLRARLVQKKTAEEESKPKPAKEGKKKVEEPTDEFYISGMSDSSDGEDYGSDDEDEEAEEQSEEEEEEQEEDDDAQE